MDYGSWEWQWPLPRNQTQAAERKVVLKSSKPTCFCQSCVHSLLCAKAKITVFFCGRYAATPLCSTVGQQTPVPKQFPNGLSGILQFRGLPRCTRNNVKCGDCFFERKKKQKQTIEMRETRPCGHISGLVISLMMLVPVHLWRMLQKRETIHNFSADSAFWECGMGFCVVQWVRPLCLWLDDLPVLNLWSAESSHHH